MTTDTVTLTIATELCASSITGVLRYSDTCHDHERAVIIADEASVNVCASGLNGLLRSPANGVCAGHQTLYQLPGDGPLHVCVSQYTQTLRVVGNLGQCASHEFGRVIAVTEIGTPPPPTPR